MRSPQPGLIIVYVYVWALREEKEEILIIERVEMIVDDDEVGSKRLISYKIYGCQENKAGYLLSDIYSSENSDATIIFLCIFPFTEGLKILGTGNQHQDLSDLKTIDFKTAAQQQSVENQRTHTYYYRVSSSALIMDLMIIYNIAKS